MSDESNEISKSNRIHKYRAYCGHAEPFKPGPIEQIRNYRAKKGPSDGNVHSISRVEVIADDLGNHPGLHSPVPMYDTDLCSCLKLTFHNQSYGFGLLLTIFKIISNVDISILRT